MRTYRVGLVGLGRIASLYEEDARARRHYPALTHAGTYSRHPRTRMVAACDLRPERLRAFGRRWKVQALYRDFRELLRRERLDILSVCAPPDAHLAVAEAAAGRVPMIFCEKPMGRGLGEAARIVQLARERRSSLAVNLYRLFDPAHREVGRRIREGEFGRIQRVNCFYGKGLRNMGSHVVSLLLSWFGRVSAVSASSLKSLGDTREPTADFTARFAAGFDAALQGCDFRNYRIFEIDVLGERGRVVLDREGFGLRFFKAAPNKAETGAKQLVLRPSPVRPTVGRALYWAVDNLVLALDGASKLLSAGKEYLETERVIEAVIASGRREGRWVSAG